MLSRRFGGGFDFLKPINKYIMSDQKALPKTLGHVDQPSLGRKPYHSVVSSPPIIEGYVTESVPHTALKLISSGKLTFDERLAVHRVQREFRNPETCCTSRSDAVHSGAE